MGCALIDAPASDHPEHQKTCFIIKTCYAFLFTVPLIMYKRRILRILGGLSLLVVIVFVGAVEMAFPYYGIKPFRRNWGGNAPAYAKPFEVETSDSLLLKGYILPADSAKGTIILLHGISACKEQFWGFSSQLNKNGCNAVIFDQRAHGQSEGTYCTFGAKEKYDITKIIDEMERRGLAKPYGIFGNSLGGAVALQALALDKRLQFGIIESTFDTYPHVALEYGADIVGFHSEFLTNHVIAKSGIIAGFDPYKVQPIESCKSITCPILMAHGTADDKIPFEFGRRNFEALKSADKKFVSIEGGSHSRLFRFEENGWPNEIETFLKRQLKHN